MPKLKWIPIKKTDAQEEEFEHIEEDEISAANEVNGV